MRIRKNCRSGESSLCELVINMPVTYPHKSNTTYLTSPFPFFFFFFGVATARARAIAVLLHISSYTSIRSGLGDFTFNFSACSGKW